MKYIQSITAILVVALLTSCTNMKNDNRQNGGGGSGESKTYTSVADAATAAKNDMMSALEKNVDLGVNRDKLKNANPGAPMVRYDVNWESLLKADSSSDLDKMAAAGNTIVPLVADNEVVSIVGLSGDNQKFRISLLGDKRLSTELDMINKVAGTTQGVRIYEIPNLQATIYSVQTPNGNMYYTSYNNMSLREGMPASRLIPMLRAEAEGFQREFGDQLPKGKLVR